MRMLFSLIPILFGACGPNDQATTIEITTDKILHELEDRNVITAFDYTTREELRVYLRAELNLAINCQVHD